MRPKYVFQKRKSRHKPTHHPLLAIDIENDPETGNFICAALYGYRKDTQGKEHLVNMYFDNQDVLCSQLMKWKRKKKQKVPFVLIAFNFGYDHVFIEKIIDDSTLFYAGSRFITARLRNGVKLLDLTNHVFGSLEDWMGYLKMEEKGIVKVSLENKKERVLMDVRATYMLGTFLEDFYVEICDAPMKLTIGANALDIFRRRFFNDYWARNDDVLNDYERKAFRGGRVEVFKTGTHWVHSYDVNSMYLSVMMHEKFPDPLTAKYIENGSVWKTYFDKYDGIYHVRVKAPKQRIMVLPLMTSKLIFPYGEFEGYWTNVELREAMKYGYEILKCYDFVYYRQSKPYFREYAKFIWENRQKFKKEGNVGMERVVKLLGNSLFGKFGQRNSQGGYWGKLEDYYGDLVDKRPVIAKREGVEYLAIADNIKLDAEHTFPVLPVFITSYARLKLFRKLMEHEDTAVYCDTDSVKYLCTDGLDPDSNKIGEWGHEYMKKQTFYKPKMYGDKCKGIPKRARIAYEDEKEIHYVYEKPIRWKESIRGEKTPGKWVTIKKIVIKRDDKRKWSENESEPLEVNE